ncbi:MAG: hypothetical protein L0Z63_01005 [Actinobacteria bacterium]|nr:hypothetical protein [Actinomycetota bacterium]
MWGGETHRVLAVRSVDPLLSLLGSIGLVAARGTGLVVDTGGQLGRGRRSLADLASDGPRLDEVGPGRSGIAVLGSGHLPLVEVESVAGILATRWPGVVVRLCGDGWTGATVPVVPLYPGCLAPEEMGAAVWQRIAGGSQPPGPGPVLPDLRSSLVRRVLGGGHPGRGRWVRAWSRVWEMPWA